MHERPSRLDGRRWPFRCLCCYSHCCSRSRSAVDRTGKSCLQGTSHTPNAPEFFCRGRNPTGVKCGRRTCATPKPKERLCCPLSIVRAADSPSPRCPRRPITRWIEMRTNIWFRGSQRGSQLRPLNCLQVVCLSIIHYHTAIQPWVCLSPSTWPLVGTKDDRVY
jgi:hypothetical protein